MGGDQCIGVLSADGFVKGREGIPPAFVFTMQERAFPARYSTR